MRLSRGGGAQCAAPFPCRKPAVSSWSHRASPRRGVSSCQVRLVAESAGPSSGRIFISYRREETAYAAGWLFDRLADSYGSGQVFKDVDSIELGDDFVDVVTRAVGSCDVLLAIVGDQWLTITGKEGQRRLDDPDDFVRLEIEAALTRNVRVIPILVNDARMPRADELPPSLSRLTRRQALELSPARFEYDTSRLLKVLDRTLAEMRTAHEGEGAKSAPAGKAPEPSTAEPPTAPASDQSKPPDRNTRQQQLADWDSEARQAAEHGRWAVVVAALERIADAQPDHPDIARRLEEARTQQKITSLQADLRRMYAARQWTAVITIDEQLAGLDPKLADLDGLVSAARDQLLQHEQARSLIEEPAEAPTQLTDPAAAPIPLLAPSPDAPSQPKREHRWLVPAIIAVAGVVAVVLAFAAFRPSDGSGTGGGTTVESEPSSSSLPPLVWRSIEPLSAPVDWPGVVALDGELWVVGGLRPGPGNEAVDTVEVYDPEQGQWHPGPTLPIPLEHAAVAADDRTVYVVGGITDSNGVKVVQDKVWMLAEDRQSWKQLASSLLEPRFAGAAAWDGQRLVFAGGMTAPEREGGLPSPEVYVLESPDDEGSQWVKLETELQNARQHLAAAADDQGQVWFIGGRGGPGGQTVFGSVDIVKDDSITAGQDVTPVHAPAAVWHSKTGVCLLGGATFDGAWDTTNAVTCPGWPKLLEDRAGAGAAIVDDVVYLVGGYSDEVEVYSDHVEALELG